MFGGNDIACSAKSGGVVVMNNSEKKFDIPRQLATPVIPRFKTTTHPSLPDGSIYLIARDFAKQSFEHVM
jgi:hypothetical protein